MNIFNLTKLSTLILLFCIVFSLSVQAQTLREYSKTDSLHVGDTFNYSITLDRNEEYDQIIFPDTAEFGSNFEIRSRQQFKVTAFKDSISYQLQFFGVSDTTISQLPILLIQNEDTTHLFTNQVPIFFSSVLAENDDAFRPLKPIYEFFTTWWPYILILLLLLAALYMGYRYYLKRQEQEEPEPAESFSPTPFTNPIKQFQQTIKQLENKELQSHDDFKGFYITLGDAIRLYFEELYHIPALESTSRELLLMLKNRSIDENLVTDTRAVLQEADMVKFAHFTPTSLQAEGALEKAYNFLQRARKVDGPRVEHLRRKYHTKIETEREQFYAKQNAEEVNT